MDTRDKILEISALPELCASGKWVAVAGAFDPLTIAQAERLSASTEPDRKVLAVVAPDASGDLLSAQARAALVAALRSVDAVVVASAGEACAAGLDVIEDLAGERKRTADFVHFVLQR